MPGDNAEASGIDSEIFERPAARRRFVRSMFDGIAGTYDLLNHLLSAGFDIRWRRQAVDLLAPEPGQRILDLATGTGDLGLVAARTGARIVGADLSVPMLRRGLRKVTSESPPRITFLCGDAENLAFPDQSFDGLTIGFGVRNFGDLEAGLSEMGRILRPGGRVVVLEFSRPTMLGLRQLYGFYFRYLLPRIGRFVSGDAEAYHYLYESVMRFPEGDAFLQKLTTAGFCSVAQTRLTAGIATLYTGLKSAAEPA